MNALQIIEIGLNTSNMIASGYLSDLTDEEMLLRPDPNCNHIKWQMGHLIVSDHQMINGCVAGTLSDLPEGFAEKYSKETAQSDNQEDFDSKSTLIELQEKQHAAIKSALANFSEADLDQPGPESMKDYAPNLGAALNMITAHWLMHAGQWAVIRRQTGRSPIF